MKMADKIRFVRQNMKKNKSRIFMTVLATAIGCAFLIMIASVAFGLQKSFVDELLRDRLLTEIDLYNSMKDGEPSPITAEDVRRISAMERVKAVTTHYMKSGEVELDGFETTTTLVFTDFEQEKAANLELEEGRMPESGSEIVVGYHLAEHLKNKQGASYSGRLLDAEVTVTGLAMDPKKNEMIESGEARLKVVGILKKPANERNMETHVMIAQSLMPSFLLQDEDIGSPQAKAYAASAEVVAALAKELREQGYSLYTAADSVNQMETIFLVMKIGLVFVGTIAVLIASIGIYNTMTMAVTERAQDIGIMKAVGAHPRSIRSIFLIESSGIGVMGALIGTVIAYGLSAAVNITLPPIIAAALDSKPPEGFVFSYIPLSLTLLSVGISVGVAVLSGMRPAERAVRIDVLRALRRDI
ncbi:ABC transporter permease [Paenibacillus sp. 32O-W]|uniref:ABC transporter permease n=1 Tax=Paenibacillus sp. 32O-W TaxID=1695218 RepID=UPI0007222361|nr:FtsX-like permease family protein [Paenibacillus sp. 32O-W]ALS26537.1 ABC transporter permease [Paenibacillus sp. 32O-W]